MGKTRLMILLLVSILVIPTLLFAGDWEWTKDPLGAGISLAKGTAGMLSAGYNSIGSQLTLNNVVNTVSNHPLAFGGLGVAYKMVETNKAAILGLGGAVSSYASEASKFVSGASGGASKRYNALTAPLFTKNPSITNSLESSGRLQTSSFTNLFKNASPYNDGVGTTNRLLNRGSYKKGF